MSEVRRPPILRVGHQRQKILFKSRQIEALELFGIVEILAHRIGLRAVLVQDAETQLVWPPITVRPASPDSCIFFHNVCSFKVLIQAFDIDIAGNFWQHIMRGPYEEQSSLAVF